MNTKSLTEQIYAYLRNGIAAGHYHDVRLPTEKELSEQFFVSRITARNALSRLAREGKIVRIRGKGSFVNHQGAVPPVPSVLKRGRPGVMGLVMGGYTPSFGVDVFHGALRRAQELGYVLIVASTDNDQEKEARIVNQLLEAGAGGIIIQPVHGEAYSREIVSAVYSGYPLVMVDRSLSGINAPFVGVDSRQATKEAVALLLDKGHTQIALLTLTDEKSSTIDERMQGFQDAFEARGIFPSKELWLTEMESRLIEASKSGKTPFEQYVDQIAEHLSRHPQITAIFGTEYTLTLAAIEALVQRKPEMASRVSLMSFDLNREQMPCVPVISVIQPQYEMGVAAVETLHGLITQESSLQRKVLLPTRIALIKPGENILNVIKVGSI